MLTLPRGSVLISAGIRSTVSRSEIIAADKSFSFGVATRKSRQRPHAGSLSLAWYDDRAVSSMMSTTSVVAQFGIWVALLILGGMESR
jgi:hypothetical protein